MFLNRISGAIARQANPDDGLHALGTAVTYMCTPLVAGLLVAAGCYRVSYARSVAVAYAVTVLPLIPVVAAVQFTSVAVVSGLVGGAFWGALFLGKPRRTA